MRQIIFSKILLSSILVLGLGVFCLSAPQQTQAADQYTDCGTSTLEFDKNDFMNEDFNKERIEELGKNETLSCLGEHLLNDCQKVRGTVVDTEDGTIIFSVEGKNQEGLCKQRMEYGDKEDLSEDSKKYANTYAEFPMKIDKDKKKK